MRPEKITPDEETIALGKWGETFWLERPFWDWYYTKYPKDPALQKSTCVAVKDGPQRPW